MRCREAHVLDVERRGLVRNALVAVGAREADGRESKQRQVNRRQVDVAYILYGHEFSLLHGFLSPSLTSESRCCGEKGIDAELRDGRELPSISAARPDGNRGR